MVSTSKLTGDWPSQPDSPYKEGLESYRVIINDPGAQTERLIEALSDLTMVLSDMASVLREHLKAEG